MAARSAVICVYDFLEPVHWSQNVSPFHSRHGLESIPEDWVLKVKDAEHILSNIETLVQL